MPRDSLAEFELLVVLAAQRLGPDRAYTVSIVDEIGTRTGRSVRRANVFTALQRLERRGLVVSRLGSPASDRGGRPPRLISITPEGQEAARRTTDAIRAMLGEGMSPARGKG